MRHILPLLLLAAAAGSRAEEIPEFDASEFEKKPYELGGYLQLRQEHFALDRSAAFYKLSPFNQSPRDTLDRTTGTLQVYGKARHGIGTFDFRLNGDAQTDQQASDHDGRIYEAAYALRPRPGLTLEAGKRSLKWGKGYVWNPIGFVERPKDPNDPQLAREGFVMADADLIWSPGGALQTIAFTPVLVPVSDNLNRDFGAPGHLNPAAKLYLLYRDTDIDFAWQAKGSRPARFGMDFARNITSNFEIHGEWARILKAPRSVTDAAGRVSTALADGTSYLLGLRYLTAKETTLIAEYYRNGSGYSESEARQFYQFVDTAVATNNAALMQRAQLLAQASYGRPNPGVHYLYLRAQQKDAFGIVYFAPAFTTIVNVQDGSFQITPELLYTGITNLELRARWFVLQGGSGTDFGEKQASQKLEFQARYYF